MYFFSKCVILNHVFVMQLSCIMGYVLPMEVRTNNNQHVNSTNEFSPVALYSFDRFVVVLEPVLFVECCSHVQEHKRKNNVCKLSLIQCSFI